MAAQIIKTPSAPKPLAKKKRSTKPRLIPSKLAYKGKVFSVFTDTVEEPGGGINVRDVIRHNGSVVILAVDESKNPNDPEIIFERQYRHAAGQFLIELPAGRVDHDETTLAAHKILRQPWFPRRVDADLPRPRHPRRCFRAGTRREH